MVSVIVLRPIPEMLETTLLSWPAAESAQDGALTERCERLQAPRPFCRYFLHRIRDEDEPAGETGSHHDRDVDRRFDGNLAGGGGDELLRLAEVWTDLVHVVRNAVDHGLETSSQRERAGRLGRCKLRFSTAVRDRKLVVEIEEYGRGIDWQGVKGAATKMGLPTATEDDLIRAMFASGLSTKDEVTTVSGRSIGLSAIRQQVDDLGGRIAVVSKPGQGTCFRFVFPLPEVGPRFGAEAVEAAASTTQ
jgi:nitrogen-specific signal transduction histidine kinase